MNGYSCGNTSRVVHPKDRLWMHSKTTDALQKTEALSPSEAFPQNNMRTCAVCSLPTYNMRTCRPPRKEVAQEARTKMQAVFPLCTAFAPQPLLTRSTLTAPRLAVRAAVAESEEVDFVVVGSGIGGLSCAGLLAASGYTVAALPRFQPPSTSTITSC